LVVESRSPTETKALAARLGELLEPGDVIDLVGPLGAGKTAFVQGLARGAGVSRGTRVTSPTFNIALEYAGRIPLYHLDLYRLSDPGELLEVGFEHYVYGKGATAVEWLDKFPDLAPENRLTIALAIAGPRARTLTVTAHGARAAALRAAWIR
jgi:tRNA threonylcarbamoyladenosine biosynthesis protein TsaE